MKKLIVSLSVTATLCFGVFTIGSAVGMDSHPPVAYDPDMGDML